MQIYCLGGSEGTEKLVNEVFDALPSKVQQFVRKSVCFLAVGPDIRGHAWRQAHLYPVGGSWEGQTAEWIILLAEGSIDRHVVAHEIAHAYEAHDRSGHVDVEARATQLATEWGFPSE